MKHTKGPWTAERYPQDQQWIADHRIIAGNKVIAFCPTGYPFANAQMMSKAPEMHAKLASARAIMQKYIGKVDSGMAGSPETYAEMTEWLKEE